MRLKTVKINKFKRFTDLTIQNIPETARLIMMAGPNGCGNLHFLTHYIPGIDGHPEKLSHGKKTITAKLVYHHENSGIKMMLYRNFMIPIPSNQRKILYVRSAYRNDPEFQIGQIRRTGNLLDEVRISRLIDNDAAVSRNYQRLASKGLEDLYEKGEASTTFERYRKESIGDIQRAMSRLFPDLELNSLGNPLRDGTFRFTKGESQGFAYKNLSGGEKAVFDLVLDIVVARNEYNDTVFCIDEPESHMNPRLQSDLLSVLYSLIPENCQLILATHSIGMMRRARDIDVEQPGTVTFLNFGDLDFDQLQVIEPTKPDRKFWKRAHQVALDDLAALVAPERVVICEGHPKSAKSVQNHSHDARCYECIFETEFPETRFVSMGNDGEVSDDRHGLAQALLSLVDGLDVVQLVDRDDRSCQEVLDYRSAGIRVLSRRNLESYLYDDDVLRALAASVDQEVKAEELLTEKKRIIDERSKGNPSDDLKPDVGQIYNACKKILCLTECGNNAKAFMRDTLAPLLVPNMTVYEELKRDIFCTTPDS